MEKYVAVFLILLIFSTIPTADAQTTRKSQSASATETFSFGPLTVQLQYVLDFDISSPKSIQSNTSGDVIIIPKNGILYTSFILNGKNLGTFDNRVDLGQQKDVAFDVPLLSVYAKPTIIAYPAVSGPAQVSPSAIPMSSMTSKSVSVYVQDNIGNYNSVDLQIPITLFLEIGAELDLVLLSRTYPVDSYEIGRFTTISERISLEKFFDTTLNLEVRKGSQEKWIQVKPDLRTNTGKTLYDFPITIQVDGVTKDTINSGRWSSDIWTDYGTHNIRAEFFEKTDKQNNALIYRSSSHSTSYSLQEFSKSSPQSGSPCGPGTHMENDVCVPDSPSGGGCLIATATYGSELAPQVQLLREIRDTKVLGTNLGAAFMVGFNQLYYSFSPTVADWERQNPIFKETVKLTITPLITSLSILNYVDINSEEEMLGFGISVILLNIGVYFVAPAILIMKIKKIRIS